MSVLKKYIGWLLLAGIWHSSALQAQNDSVFIASRLPAAPPGELRLFVFLSPECPLCKNYTRILNDLNGQYTGKLKTYGIIPGKTYKQQEVDSFAGKYKITYPLFIDQTLNLSHYLQASVTPEAILLDPEGRLLYKGAIDNWYKSLGKPGARATAFYLRDAIEETLHHRSPMIKRTHAVGCLINDF